jgi:hypothetical protein
MSSQDYMECPTCLGGSDPGYTLTPCPYCWGSRKLPKLSGPARLPRDLYRWLRSGVTKVLGRHSRFRKSSDGKEAFEPLDEGLAEHEGKTRRF